MHVPDSRPGINRVPSRYNRVPGITQFRLPPDSRCRVVSAPSRPTGSSQLASESRPWFRERCRERFLRGQSGTWLLCGDERIALRGLNISTSEVELVYVLLYVENLSCMNSIEL